MAKYDFNIKQHRSDIESGKLKLVAGKDNQDVVVLDWEFDQYYPIVAKVKAPAGNWVLRKYTVDGEENEAYCHQHMYDLYVIDDFPDMTELEQCLKEFYDNALYKPHEDSKTAFNDMIHAYAERIYNIIKSDISKRFILAKIEDIIKTSPEENAADVAYSRGYLAGMNSCKIINNAPESYNLGKQHAIKKILSYVNRLSNQYMGRAENLGDSRVILYSIGKRIKEIENENE